MRCRCPPRPQVAPVSRVPTVQTPSSVQAQVPQTQLVLQVRTSVPQAPQAPPASSALTAQAPSPSQLPQVPSAPQSLVPQLPQGKVSPPLQLGKASQA